MPVNPPTTEIGGSGNSGSVLGNWAAFIDDREPTHELSWPTSIKTYDLMVNDSQVQGLLTSMYLPVTRYRWMIDPRDSRPEVYEPLARDMGLPVLGQDSNERVRNSNRFSHNKHIHDALKFGLKYGHIYFEQVATVESDGLAHLRKLAARMPHTILKINLERDGGLKEVEQTVPGDLRPAVIPVNKLVAYVWDTEPGSWVGRSLLRAMYKPWLIKDRVIRVGAINIERAGAGVPIITAPPGATKPQIQALDKMAQKYKAGEAAGGALPNGATLTLSGIQGTQPDAAGYIRLMNEEMARSSLQMFMQLGQTETGSRALGESFIDYFALSQRALATWYADITNDHVIEDWVDWNFGEDEPAPALVYDVMDDPTLAITDLAAMIQNGAIVVDAELKSWIRDKYQLPKAEIQPLTQPPTPEVAPVAPVPPSGQAIPPTPAPGTASAAHGVPLPSRKLKRLPTAYEAASKTNYAKLDALHETAVANLTADFKALRDKQIAEIVKQVAAAKTTADLAQLSAAPLGASALATAMNKLMKQAVKDHIAEAKSQGVKVSVPDLAAVTAALKARAEASSILLAQGLAQSASTKAVATLGGSIGPKEAAPIVETFLKGLSTAVIEKTMRGVVQSSINSGRRAAMDNGEPKDIYASELLDAATCEECAAVDETQYDTLAEAEVDYPTGGFVDCLGGDYCRGTLIAVYSEGQEA